MAVVRLNLLSRCLGMSTNVTMILPSFDQNSDLGKPLEEVYDHFKGLPRLRTGPKPKKHRVLGHWMTIAEAAEKYRTTEGNLRAYMAKHQCKRETAVRRLEERRAKQAEKDIMRILGF